MDGARFEQGAMGIPVGGWDIQRLVLPQFGRDVRI